MSTRPTSSTGRLVAGETEIEADRIVLATGLTYRPPRIPGLEVAHVNATPRGMTRLVEALAGGPKRVVVVGAGLIGTETAATLAVAGHDVTAIDVLDRPLDRLHDPLPALGAAALAEAGRALRRRRRAHRGRRGEDAQATVCYKDGSLAADVVVAATGGRPFGAARAGRSTRRSCRSASAPTCACPASSASTPSGDLILAPHARFGAIRFPHWDMAIATGDRAADAIAGVESELDRPAVLVVGHRPEDVRRGRLGRCGGGVGEEDGLHVGRDATGEPVAVLVVDDPRKLRAGRALLGA